MNTCQFAQTYLETYLPYSFGLSLGLAYTPSPSCWVASHDDSQPALDHRWSASGSHHRGLLGWGCWQNPGCRSDILHSTGIGCWGRRAWRRPVPLVCTPPIFRSREIIWEESVMSFKQSCNWNINVSIYIVHFLIQSALTIHSIVNRIFPANNKNGASLHWLNNPNSSHWHLGGMKQAWNMYHTLPIPKFENKLIIM